MILGASLLGAGVVLSLVLIALDFRAGRSTEPYAGIGRIAPEYHFFPSLLSGAGAWIAWGWMAGLGAFAGQVVVTLAISYRLRAA